MVLELEEGDETWEMQDELSQPLVDIAELPRAREDQLARVRRGAGLSGGKVAMAERKKAAAAAAPAAAPAAAAARDDTTAPGARVDLTTADEGAARAAGNAMGAKAQAELENLKEEKFVQELRGKFIAQMVRALRIA